ncbi:DUF4292 domain-containing protein [Halosquirtibacter laminarini]|uniref:DUF4292 domain-containing protein n=1 Tax=Halosquirtibacter laminarini TaxID=3374600 RepID=A0AC61NNL6_9BACT|nr:DUF4292 domain-containing protein [Prolixibacteraceae bacterium]
MNIISIVVSKFLNSKIYLFVILLSVLSSCRSTKELMVTDLSSNSNNTELKKMSTSRLMRNVRNNESYYETYGAKKALIDFNYKGNKNAISASFKSKKDSVIIITAQKGIFPVGKLLATEDTIIVVNVLGRETIHANFEKVEKVIGVTVSLEKLENIFSGNPFTLQEDIKGRILRKYKSYTEGGYYVLSSIKNNTTKREKNNKRKKKIVVKKDFKVYAGNNRIEERLYFEPTHFKLKKVVYKNLDTHVSTNINIDKYVNIDNSFFPSVVTISSFKNSTPIFNMRIRLFKIWKDKESSFKFSVPTSYTNKVLK